MKSDRRLLSFLVVRERVDNHTRIRFAAVHSKLGKVDSLDLSVGASSFFLPTRNDIFWIAVVHRQLLQRKQKKSSFRQRWCGHVELSPSFRGHEEGGCVSRWNCVRAVASKGCQVEEEAAGKKEW